jgi:hypothetical protein
MGTIWKKVVARLARHYIRDAPELVSCNPVCVFSMPQQLHILHGCTTMSASCLLYACVYNIDTFCGHSRTIRKFSDLALPFLHLFVTILMQIDP